MFRLFHKIFNKDDNNNDMKYLIIGLGNPGSEYSETRHNIGFKVLDAFAEASETSFEHKRYADVVKVKFKGRIFVLVKPMTFMNLSGKAVNYWMKKEKIPIEKILIIVDDLAIPFGTIRIKDKGGDGGHNGLKDIILTLGHNKFNRLRFGIGDSFTKGQQVNYVLDKWSDIEISLLPERLKQIIGAIKNFGTIGITRTMNYFNKKYDIEIELTKLKNKNDRAK